MKLAAASLTLLSAVAWGQNAVTLPEVRVYSPRVAIQSPVATFAMPVSALRYEPSVDIQPRNFAEAQADITLRGGTFENTGIRLGALSLWDPQTGHYFAEIPVSPALLSAPQIATGAALAAGSINATSGAIAYHWRPIRTAGSASAGLGENRLRRADLYHGQLGEVTLAGRTVAADVAVAHSRSDGAIPWGDHDFARFGGRLQLAGQSAQTDLFAGYQEKFFGWPNLYTPFNSNETENLQTLLLVLNHRMTRGQGEFLEFGVSHRRNKDDYAFNRFAPVGPVHPFQHTTWTTSAAVGGRSLLPRFGLSYRAEVLADRLQSSSLVFGPYQSRTLAKFALIGDHAWTVSPPGEYTLQAGATLDHGNRHDAAVSPLIEVAFQRARAQAPRWHASYAGSTQVPTYTALNSSATAGLFRGNPHLGRQRSRHAELGVSGTVAGWAGAMNVFWRRDEALVDWTFRRGVTARSANAVDVDVIGWETFARRSWDRADVVLGYTLLAKDASFRGAGVDASFYALNYPRHRATVALTLRLGRGFELRMDNAARLQRDNLLRVVGGHRTLTSALALTYRRPEWRAWEFSAQIENVWDDDFQEVPAVPAAPRQMSFGVSYGW